jgi:hypothetical protein
LSSMIGVGLVILVCMLVSWPGKFKESAPLDRVS